MSLAYFFNCILTYKTKNQAFKAFKIYTKILLKASFHNKKYTAILIVYFIFLFTTNCSNYVVRII